MSDYTAASITVLAQEQVLERFFWAKAHDLAQTYHRPLAWIERGLQACERVRKPHDYFIDRYLKRLPVPKDEGVEAAFKDVLLEQQPGPVRPER